VILLGELTMAKAKAKAKAKKKKNPDHYEFIRVVRDGPDLNMEYKVNGATVVGRQRHDEDVSDYSNADIDYLVRSVLSVEDDDPVKIEFNDA
jgi:predicted component of type VI protein secretion system